jgi:O-antigen ligase
LLPLLLMLPALYFTYTRSALVALGLGLILVVLYLKTKIRWEIVLILAFLLVGYIATSNVLGQTFLGGRSESSQEESSIARSILFQAGTAVALDNPILGIGGGKFREVSPQYSDRVDPELIAYEQERYWGYRTLGTEEPHNDFVMIWVSYGTLALAAYLWLYFAILRNFYVSFRKSKNRFIKGLSIGLAGALITYIVNSFYHNLLVTLPLFWILAGFSLVVMRLAAREEGAHALQADTKKSGT